jgi:membrane protease YdiL (CAAX protease family)
VGRDAGADSGGGTADSEPGGRGPVPFALFVLFEAGLAPLALALGWALGQPPLAAFAWDAGAALDGLVAAGPMLVVLAASVRWPVGPLRRIKDFFDRELAPALRGCGWPDLALISVAAGVGEEMLFRGVIQGALARALGPVAGVAGAAALFGLLHPVSTAYVALAAALGAYLGAVWLATGNLLTAIVAHAVYDFIALVVLLGDRAGEGDDDEDAD